MSRTKGFDPTDILAALNAAKIRYMVIGGLAVILHGVNRHTWDLDLSVELTVDNLKMLEAALTRLGFVRRVPAPIEGLADPQTRKLWTTTRNMRVYSYIERAGAQRVIDIMVKPLRNFDDVYRHRVIARRGRVLIPLIPVDVLVKMKRPPIGSYEEARLFALERFSRLSPIQKLQWLKQMTAFIDEVNPDVRRRRLGFAPVRRRKGNG